MKKVLATSQRGFTLVAFGWIDHRVCDPAGARAAYPLSTDAVEYLKSDPEAMDYTDFSYYGPNLYPVPADRKAIVFRDRQGRKQVVAGAVS